MPAISIPYFRELISCYCLRRCKPSSSIIHHILQYLLDSHSTVSLLVDTILTEGHLSCQRRVVVVVDLLVDGNHMKSWMLSSNSCWSVSSSISIPRRSPCIQLVWRTSSRLSSVRPWSSWKSAVCTSQINGFPESRNQIGSSGNCHGVRARRLGGPQ